jgi:hypothetical protein
MMAALATSCAVEDVDEVDEVDEGSTEQGLVARSWVIWNNPNIPVCFDTGGTDEERRWVREAVRDTWEAASSVRFVNWNNCQWFNMGLRIRMFDSRGYTTGLGMELNGVAWGVNIDTHVRPNSCPLGTREACVRATAAHEFGHALGFAHEQTRADTPDSCTDGNEVDGTGDSWVGAWDQSSIMNYCNPVWSNGGFLSETDVIGVRHFYGKYGRWTDPRLFDPTFYKVANPDVSGISADPESATVDWLARGLPLLGLRGSRTFDVRYYLAQNTDLAAAFGQRFNRAIAHYEDAGVFEGRRASREFDVRFYERIYPDIAAMGGNHAAALDHFIHQGLPYEARRGSREFDVISYMLTYGDVAAAFGPSNYAGAFDHWVAYGLPALGRRGSYEVDVPYYQSLYPDAGTNRVAALDHFTRTGLGLGRRASLDFDVAYYRGAYSDVQGLDFTSAFDHWVAVGRGAGRSGIQPTIVFPPRPPVFCRPGRC